MRRIGKIALAGAAIGFTMAVLTSGDSGVPSPDEGEPMSKPLPAMLIGSASDPKIREQLDRIDRLFAEYGISYVTAYEVTKQAESRLGRPAGTVMIPPEQYWQYLVGVLRDVWMPLRTRIGKPLMIRNGYREPLYDASVGGAGRSRHKWAAALDIYRTADVPISVLKREVARIFVERGRDLEMGFGGYKANVHVDAHTDWIDGKRPATWGDAANAVEEVRLVA